MSETFKIIETDNYLRIEFINKMKPIVKFGLFIQGIMIMSFSIFFICTIIYTIFEISDFFALLFLIPISFGILYFIAGKSYLKKLTYKEEIIIKDSEFRIIESYLFSEIVKSYNIDEMAYLNYAGQQKFTNHSITNETFDAIGFNTQEKEIQYIISDGTISFFYHGETIRFGINIPTWDAEDIINKINLYTDNKIKTKLV